ncbi:MAG: hypothetical protein ABFQ53_03945, partial [Patescibacteria group bacterium]
MNKVVKRGVLATMITLVGFSVVNFANASEPLPDGRHFPADCSLEKQNPTDVLIVFNDHILLSEDSSTHVHEYNDKNIPAGRYRVSLEASDGYDGRESVSQNMEQYYVQFEGQDASTRTNVTGDVIDYQRQGVWKGVVDGEITLRETNNIITRHRINMNNPAEEVTSPNSVIPTCMLLEDLNYQPPTCGPTNGQTLTSTPTSGLCSVG